MKNFYVIEIQTHSDGSAGDIVTGYEEKNASEDGYMAARAAANDSSVYCHTVLWINKEGQYMEPPKCYHHNEPLPEAAEAAEE